MIIRSVLSAWFVVAAAVLSAPPAAAQSFPLPQPLPCAGPNVVPTAIQNLADRTAAAMRAIEERSGAWRAVRDLAEAACGAGDRATLDTVLERCIRECRDAGDRYLARVDYAGVLARFGDAAAAEAQYREAIAMRPGRPPEAIEAYNNYALHLDREGRPVEALEVLSRFSTEELRRYSFAGTLKLWVMRRLGMDVTAEAALIAPFPGAMVGAQRAQFPFLPMPGTPNERPIEPLVVEAREDIPLGPRSRGGAELERGQLYFTRMGTRNPPIAPPGTTIAKGERFVVVAALGGDACRIEHAGNNYDLVFCPWLLESGDTQRDFYRVRRRADPSTSAVPFSIASSIPTPAVPQPALDGPPSEWAIWRRFHANLEVFGRSSPSYAQDTLVGRAGLTSDEAATVVAAGREYVEQLAAVDERARAEIAARFSVPFPFEPPLPLGADGVARPPVLVPSQLPDGRSVQAVLAEEGFSARIDAEKQTVLTAHRERLAELLGTAKLAALEAVVQGGAPRR